MVKEEQLPKEAIEGYGARKVRLKKIDEVQSLYVGPRTTILKHGHEKKQWEVYIHPETKTAYVCLPGEEHELVNASGRMHLFFSIKGKGKRTLKDFETFFKVAGFTVQQGSVLISDDNVTL
jgi:hypothetical protein